MLCICSELAVDWEFSFDDAFSETDSIYDDIEMSSLSVKSPLADFFMFFNALKFYNGKFEND